MLQRYGKHFDIHNFEKKQKKTKNKKTHIHVKKVAHTLEFVWHLLINLKNNYLLQNC